MPCITTTYISLPRAIDTSKNFDRVCAYNRSREYRTCGIVDNMRETQFAPDARASGSIAIAKELRMLHVGYGVSLLAPRPPEIDLDFSGLAKYPCTPSGCGSRARKRLRCGVELSMIFVF
jgi:hypothetical protein